MVDMASDLLGPAACRGVLDTDETGVPVFGGDPQQVLADGRDRAPRALLPRRVGRGIHDDLPDDAPARMPRLTARDEEPGQRIREDDTVRLRAVGVEMPEGLGDAAAGSDGASQLKRCTPGPTP